MSDRGKIIDFVGWKRGNPLSTYETMIRALLRDINIGEEPTLTASKEFVTLLWQSREGELEVVLQTGSGLLNVNGHTKDGSVSLKNVSSTITANNRWIGYLYDDNFHE